MNIDTRKKLLGMIGVLKDQYFEMMYSMLHALDLHDVSFSDSIDRMLHKWGENGHVKPHIMLMKQFKDLVYIYERDDMVFTERALINEAKNQIEYLNTKYSEYLETVYRENSTHRICADRFDVIDMLAWAVCGVEITESKSDRNLVMNEHPKSDFASENFFVNLSYPPFYGAEQYINLKVVATYNTGEVVEFKVLPYPYKRIVNAKDGYYLVHAPDPQHLAAFIYAHTI